MAKIIRNADALYERDQLKTHKHICYGKGGGSSAPAPTSSTVYQSSLPEYAQPFFSNLMTTAQQVAQTPYQPYSGPQVQGLVNNQQQGLDIAGQLGGNVAGQMQGAQAGTQAVQNNMLNSGLGSLATGYGPNSAQAWMNPYQQTAVQATMDQMQHQGDIQQRNLAQQAQQAGAFGGYRDQLEQSENTRNLNLAMGQTAAQMNNQGYQQAQQAALGGAQLGMQGQQLGLGAAQQQASLGQQGLGNLLQTGGLQQQTGQQGMDVAYQNYLNNIYYPQQQVSWESSILHGIQPGSVGGQFQYQAPANIYSQLGGLGLGAAALNKAFGRGGYVNG
jgi:hypothetical protein